MRVRVPDLSGIIKGLRNSIRINVNKRKIGKEQEQHAVEYLKQNGYSIVQTNFQCRIGEIDIIAYNEGYLVFLEVKYRRDCRCGYPEEAVDYRKQLRISKAAAFYLTRYCRTMVPSCRFDVVAITPQEIRLYKNAFEYAYKK